MDTSLMHKSLSLFNLYQLFDLLCFVLEATEECSSRTLSGNSALHFLFRFVFESPHPGISMCSPQGAGEEDSFCLHGCERTIQHPAALLEAQRTRLGRCLWGKALTQWHRSVPDLQLEEQAFHPLRREGGDRVCLFTCRLPSQLGGTSKASVPVCGMAAACVIRTKQGSMTENPSIPGL